jgi:hypothetical protein
MNERKGWNGWWLDGLRLRYHPHSYGKSGTYTLNLERVTDVAALMDLIFQTAGREWADDRALAGLVRALDQLLRPRATLCRHDLTAADIRAIVQVGAHDEVDTTAN